MMKDAWTENKNQFLECSNFLKFLYHLEILGIMRASESIKTISFCKY